MRVLFTWVFLMVVTLAWGQQLPTYNMYSQNLYLINPAFAGYWQGTNAHVYAKSIYNGLPNTPRQIDVGVHQAIPALQAAFGGRLIYDERAAFQMFQLSATAAYKLSLSQTKLLTAALDLGFVNRSFNPQAVNEFTNGADPVIQSDYFNTTKFRFSAGVTYVSPQLELGFSMPQMIEGGERINPHMMGYAAGNFFAGKFLLKPNTLVQYLPDGSVVADLNLLAEFAQTIWVQPGFRSNLTALLSLGFIFDKVQLGYSFSLYAGTYDNYQGNAHEIVLSLQANDGGRARSFIDRMSPYQQRGIRNLFRRRN